MTVIAEIKLTCPLCGGHDIADDVGRELERCMTCRALKRTRVAALFAKKFASLGPGSKVLHFAPEKPLADYLSRTVGEGYAMADISRSRYAPMAAEMGVKFEQIDLCRSISSLPENHYDLVVHSHVLEHVPCNYTCVLQGLHRLVRPGGAQLFAVPMRKKGGYREDQSPDLTSDERWKRFGRHNHVRSFALDDLPHTIGAVFDLSKSMPEHCFSAEELAEIGAPADYVGVFYVRK